MTQPRVRTKPTPSPTAVQAPAGAGGEAPKPGVHVVTFGCQMNKYDSLLVEGRFVANGYRLVEESRDADVLLFNTCSVRDHAEERVYSWLGELKRAKETRPGLVIGVLGCMAQRVEDDLFARAGHVDVVCGTREIHRLPELVDEVRARRDEGVTRAASARLLATDMGSEVRVDRDDETYEGGLAGYLAVMRGCDLNCTFCIVPTVRGRVQSRPIEELVHEARWMVAGGAKVITLLGQTVDAYGEDLPKPGPGDARGTGRQGRPSLADLLRALQEVEGLVRIRLITLHPAYVTPALAQAIRDCDKVDRFLPLPAQSGSDDVLRRMKRGYTTDLYRRRIDILRAEVPDIELGSDWIVGFPGETEEDFAKTEAFVDEIGFLVNYVFKYDPRPGTAAFALQDDVTTAQKKERNARLLAAGERTALARMRSWIGRKVEVFLEEPSPRRSGMLKGRTFHNLPISVPYDGPVEDALGTVVRARVADATAYGLGGVLEGATTSTASP